MFGFLLLVGLWISPEEVIRTCKALCKADSTYLARIEHSWYGYKCWGTDGIMRPLETAKTVWVQPTGG